MRSAEEMKQLIINRAKTDDRIRAVLLNGSRANSKIKQDIYQDFDIVYLVTEMESFVRDHAWVDHFGERIIWQLPEEMCFGNSEPATAFTYLMLFTDGNRIDLTLYPLSYISENFKPSSLTIVWLDKDNLFTQLPAAGDHDYLVTPPGQQLFSDTCNEFWWVNTYVAKGLMRNDMIYAKQMMENVVRVMFMRVVEWYAGSITDFSVSTGAGGKFIHLYLQADEYKKILNTYADSNVSKNWEALFTMHELFSGFAQMIAGKLGYYYNLQEEQKTVRYLHALYNRQATA